MTEYKWLTSDKPAEMLGFLRGGHHDAAHIRKLRLFTCACARLVWPLLTDGRSRRAVEVSERYADGMESYAALIEADRQADAVLSFREDKGREYAAAYIAAWVADPRAVTHYHRWGCRATQAGINCSTEAHLLRDIFGNPFRPFSRRPAATPEDYDAELSVMEWRRRNGGAVARIAQHIYEERRWEDMPILADALEDAGCPATTPCPECGGSLHVERPMASQRLQQCMRCWDDGIGWPTGEVANALLLHCRGQEHPSYLGPPRPQVIHARGCWVIDLLIGKA